MEDQEKTTYVSSSMIELKAELFRKQEEFKKQKAATSGFVKGKREEKVSKKSKWNNSNVGVEARAQRDVEEKEEDEDVLEKSRRMLEQKSKMYEKLTNSSSIPEEDGSDYYLVDFQKKAIDAIVEEREAARQREEEDEKEAERCALAVETPEISPGEEWVDFTDSLGRDRRCMKKDLDQLMKRDRELAMAKCSNKVKDGKEVTVDRSNNDGLPHLMSADMHREMMRQKWEDESKALMDKEQDEIHYSNVQFDEIRSHGVGFYQFSKDHEKREEQLNKLKKMREETVDERSRKDQIKDKRKMMMEARLAKVRQRRKLKDDVNIKDETPENKEEVIGPKVEEASLAPSKDTELMKKEEKEKEAEAKRRSHIRERDKDKVNSSKNDKRHINPNKNYVETRRDERDADFAPPAMYFDEPKVKTPHTSNENYTKRLEQFFKASTSSPDAKAIGNTVPQTENQKNIIQDLKAGKGIEKTDLAEKAHDRNSSSVCQKIESIPLPLEPIPAGRSVPNSVDSGLHTSGSVKNKWSRDDPQIGNNSLPAFSQQDVGQYGSNLSHQQQYNNNPNYMMHHPQQYTYNQQPYTSYNHQQFTSNYTANINHNPLYNPTAVSNKQPPHWDTSQPLYNSAEYIKHAPGTQNNSFPNPAASVIQENATSMEPKRPKIPKMSIIDTRFVKNDETSVENVADSVPSDVSAVMYTPGSYTAAKQTSAEQYEECVADLRIKNQISGGPCLYTKEEKEQQQLEVVEVEKEQSHCESIEDKKVQEFLSSLK